MHSRLQTQVRSEALLLSPPVSQKGTPLLSLGLQLITPPQPDSPRAQVGPPSPPSSASLPRRLPGSPLLKGGTCQSS